MEYFFPPRGRRKSNERQNVAQSGFLCRESPFVSRPNAVHYSNRRCRRKFAVILLLHSFAEILPVYRLFLNIICSLEIKKHTKKIGKSCNKKALSYRPKAFFCILYFCRDKSTVIAAAIQNDFLNVLFASVFCSGKWKKLLVAGLLRTYLLEKI